MCLYIIKFIFILIIMSKIENYIHINNNPKINIDKLLNKKIKHTDYMYKDILLFLRN
jgi:disulfide oxidoreductase YuzD